MSYDNLILTCMIELTYNKDNIMLTKNLKKLNVLAVDDEELIVKHLEKNLSNYCKNFKACICPTDAYEYFKNNEIDIVICDIRMPIMNGIELCQKLKELNEHVTIVMLSASNDSNYLLDAINMGINKFLIKPCRIKEILNVLEGFATQICATKEADTYNSFMQEKLEIKNKDFDEMINHLHQYERAINKTNLVRKIDPNGIITSVNKKFRKTRDINQNAMAGNRLNSYEKIIDTLNKEKNYETTNIFENENKTYLKSNYFPIYDLNDNLKELLEISHDVSEIHHLNDELYKTQEAIIFMLSSVIENRCKETASHVQRVSFYSEILGKEYGLDENDIELLKMASPLHDIGKITVADDILNKPGALSDKEFELIKGHTTIGYEILKNSDKDILNTAAMIAYEHHENWDGTGYPQNLKEEEIHIFSRITSIADVFDALTHDRCYKKAWSTDKVISYIKEESGKKFEPKLVEIFLNNIDVLIDIKEKYNETN